MLKHWCKQWLAVTVSDMFHVLVPGTWYRYNHTGVQGLYYFSSEVLIHSYRYQVIFQTWTDGNTIIPPDDESVEPKWICWHCFNISVNEVSLWNGRE